jgi:molybdopterin synthase sulfur carrier subunit
MPDPVPGSVSSAEPAVGTVTVRYWAAARAAAGVEQDEVAVDEGTTLADVLAGVGALHADRQRLAEVVAVCSVLVGERPVGSADPAQVPLRAGDVVELLPPFAGG